MNYANTSYNFTWLVALAEDKDPLWLNSELSVGALEAAIYTISNSLDTVVVNSMSHEYPKIGVSVCSILANSHVIVHTYPESKKMTIDVHTCQHVDAADVSRYNYAHAYRGRVRRAVEDSMYWFNEIGVTSSAGGSPVSSAGMCIMNLRDV